MAKGYYSRLIARKTEAIKRLSKEYDTENTELAY